MKNDFTQTSVTQLRKILVDSGKFTQEQADELKGKAKIVEAVMSLQENAEDVVDFSKIVETAVSNQEVVVQEDKSNVPSYNSPEWNDYVLTHFTEKELKDGKYPKVDGLRRVAQLLLGNILSSGPKQVFPPQDHDNCGRATVVYEVVFDWFQEGMLQSGERRFSSVAGSWIGNTDDEYSVFPEAIAETRAEARALRRALRLNVASAEELTNKDTKQVVRELADKASTGEWEEDDIISRPQITFIKKGCERLGIDLDKFIKSGKEKFETLESVPRKVALEMIQRINEYQTTGSQSIVIPEEIKL